MRVDHHGVRAREAREVPHQGEEAAVRGVHVQARAVLGAEVRDGAHVVHGAERRGAERGHHRAHATRGEPRRQRLEVEAAELVLRQRLVPEAEHRPDPRVRVVGVVAGHHHLARAQLTRHPQGLEVGDRPRGGQVPEPRLADAQHPRQPVDALALEPRRGRPAVERVVVRVEQHRRGVRGPCHRVRRLEHLPRVARRMEGVVVGQPFRQLAERLALRRALPVLLRGERAERQERLGAAPEPVDVGRIQRQRGCSSGVRDGALMRRRVYARTLTAVIPSGFP